MKKLPNIIIRGHIDKLIEIEPLLVMSGYTSSHEESWNKYIINDNKTINALWLNSNAVGYYSSPTDSDAKKFYVSEVKKILSYIENF